MQNLPETGGPEPYGSPQNQQRHRPGASGPENGQETHHRRNRGRTTRSGHGYSMCPDGNGMRGLHGKDRCGTAAGKRGAHADAGGQGGSRDFGQHDPEGCYERSHTRLVLPPGGHVLCDWFHSGASSLPRHGSPLAVGHQRGNQKATDGTRRT